MSTQYMLGQQTELKDQPALPVRFVHSTSLFEDPNGNCYLIEERYVELKCADGNIEFVQLDMNQRPFEDKKSGIKGLDPIIWSPKR